MTAPFRSPEHCLSVAFAFEQLRIEPRNSTNLVLEVLRARRGMQSDFDRVPSDLSQHDWHAQATLAIQFVERTLRDHPMLWQAILAEYSHGVEGALAIQKISKHIAPDAENRMLTDMIVMRLFRRAPTLRFIGHNFGLSKDAVARRERHLAAAVADLRDRARIAVIEPMQRSGLI